MNTEKIVIDIFLYIFEAWVFRFYAGLVSTPRKKNSICISCITAGYAILLTVYEFNNLLATGFSIVLICTLLFSFLYSMNIKNSLFHSFILFGVMVASEVVTMSIVTLVADSGFDIKNINPYAYLIDVIISKLTYFIILVIIARFFAKKEHKGNKDRYSKPYWFMLIMPLSGIVMMTIFRNVSVNSEMSLKNYILWIVSAFLVLFSNVIIFVIFEISQKDAMELSDLKAIQKQIENDERYFKIIEQSNKDMQVFAHDIKNHFIQIRNMENFESAKNYIDSIYPQIETFSSIGISQNKMLDLIISKYIKLCESKSIKFSVDVKTANLNYIADSDLASLLNNLLDNAVESAEQTEERTITLKLSSKSKAYDVLSFSNSCNHLPNVCGDKLQTTKKNKELHGIGLRSVMKIINKYDGFYDWKYDRTTQTFKTIIAFPKTPQN